MDDSGTVKVQVDVERGLLDLAENAGLDVSALTTQALKRALGPRLTKSPTYAEDAERARREIADEVGWYNRHVEEHGLFADEWRTF